MLGMKFLKKLTQKFIKSAVDNYIISIFIVIVLMIGIISLIKLLKSDSEFVYAEVKVSQGLWWANVGKPAIWMVDSVHEGDTEVDGRGNVVSEIEEIRYYPARDDNLYDVYLLLKIKANYNENTSKYTFKRSVIGLGSPIELEFPNLQVSGTVMNLSKQPIKYQLLEKEIVLSKRLVASQEYNAIKVGDSYSDGKEKVFEVVDKQLTDSYIVYSSEGNNYPIEANIYKDVTLRAKIKVRVTNGLNIFGREQVIRAGKFFEISTSNFKYLEYKVESIN